MRSQIDPIDLAALIIIAFAGAIALGTITLNVNVFGGIDFASTMLSFGSTLIRVLTSPELAVELTPTTPGFHSTQTPTASGWTPRRREFSQRNGLFQTGGEREKAS